MSVSHVCAPPQLRVSVRHPREMRRTYYYTRHVMKTLRYTAAGFIGTLATESTLCSAFPRIPGEDVQHDWWVMRGEMYWQYRLLEKFTDHLDY